ncbi:MAG: DUF4338 domain-containing protein [Elusimicrobia bacterium]|nr:DUF4338 domain-containing protein [Elusimicrobiota bacterium]
MIEKVKQLTQEDSSINRTQLSQLICQEFGCFQPNGKPQAVACREILRRLERMGFLELPKPRHDGNNGHKMRECYLQEEWDFVCPSLEGRLSREQGLELERARDPSKSKFFREMMVRYHYLGYRSMVGDL